MKKHLVQVFILLALMPAVLFGADSTTFNPGAVEAHTVSGVPVGGVIAWKSTQVPDGWLECNGQSTADYPKLTAVVGSAVPDLRGEFIRGWSNGKMEVDGERTLGSWQEDMFKAHSHSLTGFGNDDNGGNYVVGGRDRWQTRQTDSTGGTETRPRNVALMYIIRAE